MSVNFILGPSGSGKSTRLYKRIIKESIENPNYNYFLIVPEQYTLEAQREIVTLHPNGGTMNIDAIGLNRLAYRIFDELGVGTGQVLEDFGKSMLIKKILCEQKDNLKVYGGYYDKMGFVDEMKSMMSEIFQYNIKKEDIGGILDKLDDTNPVYHKLQDIELIYNEFEKFTGSHYIVAEQLSELLALHAEESGILKNSYLYFDGFTGFTPVQMELINKLMKCSLGVTFAFTVDGKNLSLNNIKEHELFYLTKNTIKQLMTMAASGDILINEPEIIEEKCSCRFKDNKELGFLERNIFRFPHKTYKEGLHNISLVSAENAGSEVEFVASEIRRLVRDCGYRYRDIAIVTGDLEEASNIYERVMAEYDIPVFIDANTSLKGNPCSETIRSVLNIFIEDFSYDSVFRFLKAGMTDMITDDVEVLENYALERGLKGYRRWARPVPESYSKNNYEYINNLRKSFLDMLTDIRKVFTDKNATCSDYVEALYDFLIKLKVYEKLEERKSYLYEENRMDEGDAYGQVFEKTVRLFDKITELLSDVKMSVKEFYEIIDAGLSEIEIGVVPPTVDRVMIGDLTRSRLNHIKVLMFTSVNEGVIPKSPKKGKILGDRDREVLALNGLELAPSEKVNGFVEQFYIYSILTKPSDKLYISYKNTNDGGEAVRPSYLVGRIKSIFPELNVFEYDSDKKIPETDCEALKFLINNYERRNELSDFCVLENILSERGFKKELEAIAGGFGYKNTVSTLDSDTVKLLYGEYLKSSVSKLEKYAECGFAYFLRYGLKLKEREKFSIDSRDLGTMMHAVMEKLFKSVRDTKNNDWKNLEDDERSSMVTEIVNQVAEENGDFFDDSSRNKYMFNLIEGMAQRSATMLQKHINLGSMKPDMLEKIFDSQSDGVDKYVFTLDNGMKMSITGVIDRIDTEEEDGKVYMKLIDYKSSEKKLDKDAIIQGRELQLMTYSAIAYELEKAAYPDKEIEIAGLLYYSFDEPLIETNSGVLCTDGEADFSDTEMLEKERMKEMKMNGFVNASPEIILKMDRTKNTSLPVTLLKDDVVKQTDNVVSDEELNGLLNITRDNIEEIGNNIAGGNIDINPFKYKQDTGCRYCDYKKICHFDIKTGGNSFRRLNNKKANKSGEEC